MRPMNLILMTLLMTFSQNVMAEQAQTQKNPEGFHQLTHCRHTWNQARQSNDIDMYEKCLTACTPDNNSLKQNVSVLRAYHLHCRILKRLHLSNHIKTEN